MPTIVQKHRFSVIHPSRIYVPGGSDATLVQHSYPDIPEVLKAVDDLGLFDDKRESVQKWLGSAKAGETHSLHRGHVAIVLVCHEVKS